MKLNGLSVYLSIVKIDSSFFLSRIFLMPSRITDTREGFVYNDVTIIGQEKCFENLLKENLVWNDMNPTQAQFEKQT